MTDRDDLMDQRLREAGARWRREAAPAPGVDVGRLGGRRRSRGPLLVAAAAAAVAAVIAGSQLGPFADRSAPAPQQSPPASQAPTGPPSPSSPSGTPSPTRTVVPQPDGLVPWAALAPTHPDLPTFTEPGRPDPAAAAAAPACRATDLSTTSELDAGAGTRYLDVTVELAHGDPCRLEGYPGVRAHVAGDGEIPVEHEPTGDGFYQGPLLVTGDRPAVLALAWSSSWCTDPVRNDSIRAVLPDGGGALELAGFGRSPGCYGEPGSGPTPIRVRTFQPESFTPPSTRSVYAGLDVAGDLSRSVDAGKRVRFTVTLTAKREIVLDPCPDYTIGLSGNGVSQEETYALNCAEVATRDEAGRPVLPAGKPVRFAMQVTAPDQDVPKLTWTLVVPGSGATVSGTLAVRAG